MKDFLDLAAKFIIGKKETETTDKMFLNKEVMDVLKQNSSTSSKTGKPLSENNVHKLKMRISELEKLIIEKNDTIKKLKDTHEKDVQIISNLVQQYKEEKNVLLKIKRINEEIINEETGHKVLSKEYWTYLEEEFLRRIMEERIC